MAKRKDPNFNDRPGQTRINLWVPTDLLHAYQEILAERAAAVSADIRLYIRRTVEAAGPVKKAKR